MAILIPMLRWFEHHQVYFPSRRLAWTPSASGWAFEDVRLTAKDGVRLHGWFMPTTNKAASDRKVVLHLHGNGGNISHRFEVYATFQRLGLSILALDYRGYGQSEGKPSEQGTYLDAEAGYQWLRQRDYADSNILAFGESLGGGVASELALRQPLGGLVLQSTFTSIPDIGAELFRWLPVRWISTIKYDTHGKLPLIRVPVLILHSRHDTLVRFHHAEKNLAAANEPKELWEILGDHNDALLTTEGRARFEEGLARFLRGLNGPPH